MQSLDRHAGHVTRTTPARLHGFTLIELSIVLVIIGLIVGGVLVGQTIILSATLRSVVKQQEAFKTAVGTFRDKYGCLPGDCPNATTFGFTSPNPGNFPVNGNGDGIIGDTSGYLFDGWGLPASEQFSFWQQLVEAGYIPSATSFQELGYAPANIRNDTWWVGYSAHANTNPWPGYATGPLGNILALVGVPGQCGFDTCGGAKFSEGITPAEAQGIDAKIDDGLPNAGRVQAASSGNWIDTNSWNTTDGSAPNLCVGGAATDTAALYAAPEANNNTRCNLLFTLGF